MSSQASSTAVLHPGHLKLVAKPFFFFSKNATSTKSPLVQQSSCMGEEDNEQVTSPDICKGAGLQGISSRGLQWKSRTACDKMKTLRDAGGRGLAKGLNCGDRTRTPSLKFLEKRLPLHLYFFRNLFGIH